MSEWIDVAALLKVLAASLVAGAGLAMVFGLGLVGLSAAQTRRVRGGGAAAAPTGLAVALACFTIVAAGVVYGVYLVLNK